jgi:hypothetical protein
LLLLSGALLVLPAAALAQSAGDEQYADPFGPTDQPDKSGNQSSGDNSGQQTQPAPQTQAPVQSTVQAEPADPAGDSGSTLPRTGLPALILAASGAALFASGGALRRRADRPDVRRPAGQYVPWEAHRAVRERH